MIIPAFDKNTYKMILENLPPEERQILEMIIEESGGIDKFTESVNAAVGPMVEQAAADFDYEKYAPDQINKMTDDEFEYFVGNEPVVTKAQEEMAWQATDELMAKFFKKA